MSDAAFEYTIYCLASPERVFDALTDRADLDVYMGGTGPKSTWEVGETVLWKFGPDGEFEERGQRVLVDERPSTLSYTWHTTEGMRELYASDAEYERGLSERSTVTFTVEPGEIPEVGTKLSLRHDGFDSPDSPMLAGTRQGWVMILSMLKSHVEGVGA